MPRPLTPKGYMERLRRVSLYDRHLNYMGERVIYAYGGKVYTIKTNGKAYQVAILKLDNKKYVVLKPNGDIKS